VLFRAHGGDPERIHEDMIAAWRCWVAAGGPVAGGRAHPLALQQPVDGGGSPRFPGRVGLAAGMDKDGRAALAWQYLGFAFAELGTVTAHAQPGNPIVPASSGRPASAGLVNRMGFNNARRPRAGQPARGRRHPARQRRGRHPAGHLLGQDQGRRGGPTPWPTT
jgi:dihydroorotate dehydrogenase